MTRFMSEEIGSLVKALSIAQASIKNVTKDKAGYNYKYADLASCLDVIKEPFSENGLAISQVIVNDLLFTLLMHESGQWLQSTFILKSEGTNRTNDMQALGSGISYARRYALSAIVGLAQEDDDGASSIPIVQKQSLKEVDNDIEKFKKLCEHHGVDIKEFAQFHQIKSKNPDSVKDALFNFNILLNTYKAEKTYGADKYEKENI